MLSRSLVRSSAIAAIILSTMAQTSSANSLGINIYGLSYHVNNRRGEKLFTTEGRFNEVNTGVGARASFGTDSAATTLFVEGGFFSDTFEKQAKYLSVGFQVRLIYQLRVGINAAVYTTESIRDGNPFFAPVPILSYTFEPVTLNFVYLPKYEGHNPWHTIGAYATINFIKGEPTR